MRRSWRWYSALWQAPALLALWVGCGPMAAAEAPIEIGRTIFVVNDVEGKLGEAEPKRVVVNENVLYEEDIVTADQAETIMEFRDGSTFEVGAGATVRIDSFVFNPEESVSRKAISVGRGVFRYISGIAADEQDARISTGNGVLAIRGSVVSGIVDPEVPTFVYVGEGAATFTNDAGSTDMEPGAAIAVPSRTVPVMRSAAMPPAIAAQALQAIERRLPPRDVLRNRPHADPAWLRRAGAANLLPVAEQARRQGATPARPLPVPSGPSPIARELGLLVEGRRRNLFDGAQTARTPEQQAFIAEATRMVPNAPMLVARSTAQAGVLHQSARLAGTAVVIRGVAAAAPSPEVVTRIATAAVRANPAAAPVIARNATAGLPGPARTRIAMQLSKAAAEAKKAQAGIANPQARPAASGQASEPQKTAGAGRPPLRQEAERRSLPSRPPPIERASAAQPEAPPASARPPLRQQTAARPPPRPAVRAPPARKQVSTRPTPIKPPPHKRPASERPGAFLPR